MPLDPFQPSLKPIGSSVLPTGWHRHPHFVVQATDRGGDNSDNSADMQLVSLYSTLGRSGGPSRRHLRRISCNNPPIDPPPATNQSKHSSNHPNSRPSSCHLQRRHTTYSASSSAPSGNLVAMQKVVPGIHLKQHLFQPLTSSSSTDKKHVHSWHRHLDAVSRVHSSLGTDVAISFSLFVPPNNLPSK